MGMQCDVCGKKPVLGNHYARRGKAKYLGGVGRKVTGISRRAFKPNLQTMQCQVGGSVQTLRVCVQCLRSGKVKRPQRRQPWRFRPQGRFGAWRGRPTARPAMFSASGHTQPA